MFTGIVRRLGRLTRTPRPSGRGGLRLEIELGAELAGDVTVGDSLAVAGACLTVTERSETGCVVEVSPETLRCTALGGLTAGSLVNLETPLRVGDLLGGHFLQGHVDGVATVLACRDLGEHRVVRFELPAALAALLVEKGSVAVDGVSLTVAARGEAWFEVALIPHTLETTTLAGLEPSSLVHLEMDVLAKYVRQALATAGRLGP